MEYKVSDPGQIHSYHEYCSIQQDLGLRHDSRDKYGFSQTLNPTVSTSLLLLYRPFVANTLIKYNIFSKNERALLKPFHHIKLFYAMLYKECITCNLYKKQSYFSLPRRKHYSILKNTFKAFSSK